MKKYWSNVIKKNEKLEEKNQRQNESILGQLQVLKKKNFVRAKTILEIINNFERATMDHDHQLICVNKVPTGPEAAVFFSNKKTT